MINKPIAHRRMQSTRLTAGTFTRPEEVVSWLGAVQAQDYPAAKWALGLRLPHLLDADVEQAFNDGLILRTHILRPTWHFVTPQDIRWMLELTGPRVHAANKFIYRQTGLDAAAQSKGRKALIKALQGGKHLTRDELAAALPAGFSEPTGLRFLHIMMHAELEGIICSGPRHGKKHTYALLEERAPNARSLPRDEALAALVIRYFTSHGPATAQDFAWWSGLTLNETRTGLEMAKRELSCEEIGGQTYWFAESPRGVKPSPRAVYLLPNYDEYIVAYQDRSAIFAGPNEPLMDARGNVLFQHTIMIDGLIVGVWKRTLAKQVVTITTKSVRPPTAAQTSAIAAAAKRYGEFLGLPVNLA